MRIQDLEWLVTLAEVENVTDAAATLGTNQPTLSRALARVEAELGTRLFERASDGVHLTPTGSMTLAAARSIVATWTKLGEDIAGVTDPDAGVMRLAFLDSMATSLVPTLLREFHALAPRVRVSLAQEPAHEIEDDLRSGAVDVAVTTTRPAGAFGWRTLQQERLVLVVPPRHPLARRRAVLLAELDGEELITTPLGYGYRTVIEGLLEAAGAKPEIAVESQDLATIEGLVAAGLGIAILPEHFAGISGTVGIRIRAAAARRSVGLTWRTDHELPPPSARFRDFVLARSSVSPPPTGSPVAAR